MKIIIATGGTGGHIYPALHVASELKREGHTVYFAGVFGKARQKIKDCGYPLKELSGQGLYADSIKSVMQFSLAMIKSIFESSRFLKDIKPDRVLGFGGYGAFPVVITAALLRYPTMIHEQNVLPGRANRILAQWVKKIAVSFEKSKSFFSPGKTIMTGCPCRHISSQKEKGKLIEEFGLQEGRYTILIMGGSQGSHRINAEFIQTASSLKDVFPLQVLHISGEKDYNTLKKSYDDLGIPYRLVPFLEAMDNAYETADLIISRAGAVTITEIAAFGLPSILIPYPFAAGHQRENANILVKAGTAKMIEEKDLFAERLKEMILAFMQNPMDREEIKKLHQEICRPNAARLLANEVLMLS